MAQSHPGTLPRQRVQARRGLVVPGAANALAARVIEQLGFEAVYLSGAGLTNTAMGFGLVLYANAALQGAVRGMTLALQQLRDGGRLDEASGLVATFAQRQALVRKDDFDALDRRYG